MLVSVCVCTYKRPQLEACLESIASQKLPHNVAVNIVVVDNCAELSAQLIVDRFSYDHCMDIAYSPLSDKNLSRVRNHALSMASGEFVALIDDDEIASESWLRHLLDCANEYKADVVVGPVFNIYSKSCPSWLASADLMSRLLPSTGKPLKTGHAGNALIRKSILEESAIRFDERLGSTGGEDTDFFFRLHKSGANIIGCYEATAHEVIDPSRENMVYLIQENKRIGQVFCRAIWPLLSFYERFVALILIFTKVCYFGTGFILTRLFGKRFFAYWQLRFICNIEKCRYLLRKDHTIAPYCS